MGRNAPEMLSILWRTSHERNSILGINLKWILKKVSAEPSNGTAASNEAAICQTVTRNKSGPGSIPLPPHRIIGEILGCHGCRHGGNSCKWGRQGPRWEPSPSLGMA